MKQSNLAAQLLSHDSATLSDYGTLVIIGDPNAEPPVLLPAEMIHSGHELIRGIHPEGDSEEKRPIVFVFPSSAWGIVTEGTQLNVGSGLMQRTFRVAPPLHPQWVQGQVAQLVVAAFQD